MDDKLIKKLLKDNDQEISLLINQMSAELSQLIRDVIENGTSEQIESINNMLENNLNLANSLSGGNMKYMAWEYEKSKTNYYHLYGVAGIVEDIIITLDIPENDQNTADVQSIIDTFDKIAERYVTQQGR